eukprot:TRINITY_DN937_c0_g1_i9.p2 TRINITY_DN937_c0_g1~~TRINITY_DN937_c0_g1_i9.p2  ORF type:complete len:226 (-),score=10.84 TRINITY_DN937_c0_g1_i9:636-1313(-)
MICWLIWCLLCDNLRAKCKSIQRSHRSYVATVQDEELISIALLLNDDLQKTFSRYTDLKRHKMPEVYISALLNESHPSANAPPASTRSKPLPELDSFSFPEPSFAPPAQPSTPVRAPSSYMRPPSDAMRPAPAPMRPPPGSVRSSMSPPRPPPQPMQAPQPLQPSQFPAESYRKPPVSAARQGDPNDIFGLFDAEETAAPPIAAPSLSFDSTPILQPTIAPLRPR